MLLIDMDSQASATATLLDELPPDAPRMAHVIVGQASLEEIAQPSHRPGVALAPASKELTHALLPIA